MDDVRLNAQAYDNNLTITPVRSIIGNLLNIDWRQALVLRGYGWQVNLGSFNTPLTGGGAGTVLDRDEPELMVVVPVNYALVPLRVHVQLRHPLVAADNDTVSARLCWMNNVTFPGDGTFTALTPTNMLTNGGQGYVGSVPSQFTVGYTNGGDVETFEICRSESNADVQGTAANAGIYQQEMLYQPETPPFLQGPGMLKLHWGGTVATPGFCQLNYLIIPKTMLDGIV